MSPAVCILFFGVDLEWTDSLREKVFALLKARASWTAGYQDYDAVVDLVSHYCGVRATAFLPTSTTEKTHQLGLGIVGLFHNGYPNLHIGPLLPQPTRAGHGKALDGLSALLHDLGVKDEPAWHVYAASTQ